MESRANNQKRCKSIKPPIKPWEKMPKKVLIKMFFIKKLAIIKHLYRTRYFKGGRQLF